MKAKKCRECGNETFQDDDICVLCKIGVTQMYRELDDLIKKKDKWHLNHRKTAGAR